MSMMGGAPKEHGATVAEYSSYEAAQKSVSTLIASDVPAQDIAIVGRGLRSVERVTGRLGYATAARSGAINGVLLGLLFAAIFVLGSPGAALQLFVGVMLVGIALGMLMSIISYSILRRRRDFTSVTQVIADHYDVTVLPRSFGRAKELLGPSSPPAAAAPVDLSSPPRYGERIDPAAPPVQPGERVDPAPVPAGGERVDPAEPPRYGERVDPTPAPPAAGGETVDPAPAPPAQPPQAGPQVPEQPTLPPKPDAPR
ncbi:MULTISPECIES: general stress protein [unclassified Microbacterium]|uniref:general stress protein n=1 Tax=unclassified Microbacterium TaxID=2609290 RepID=UPI002004A64B|nr:MULTISPECIES: general stress protein [unclassified Microbacterium]